MKDPYDHSTEDIMNKLADFADPKLKETFPAYKVVYQFVGNNHMLRTNNLVFFTETPEKARALAEAFLKENNLPWYKILSAQRA